MGKSVLIKIDSARQERIVVGVVQAIFEKMMGLNLSAPPTVKRNHIKWNEKYRMIARARDKGYEQGARVAVVNFYLNDRFMQRDQPCGSVILYSNPGQLPRLLAAAGISPEEAAQESVQQDFCAEMINMIAGGVVNRLAAEAAVDPLVMSMPASHKDEVTGGLIFDRDTTSCLEISFAVGGQSAVVVDFTLAQVQTQA